MKIEYHFEDRVLLDASKNIDEIFIKLQDVEYSIGKLFPGLKDFKKEHDDDNHKQSYRWDFKEFSFKNRPYHIVLHTLFHIDGENKNIIALPKDEASNDTLKAQWSIMSHNENIQKSSSLDPLMQASFFFLFKADIQFDLPIPFLLQPIIPFVAQNELKKLFDTYIKNIKSRLFE